MEVCLLSIRKPGAPLLARLVVFAAPSSLVCLVVLFPGRGFEEEDMLVYVTLIVYVDPFTKSWTSTKKSSKKIREGSYIYSKASA